MNSTLTITEKVHFRRGGRGGRRQLLPGQAPQPPLVPGGREPRVAKLVALAIRFGDYLRRGVVANCRELAELGHVTRARISQVMNLLLLAPDIQEALLFLPRTPRGRDPLILRDLQPLAAVTDWTEQRRLWQ